MNDPEAIDSLLGSYPEVMTAEEVADLMRVGTSTVARWSRDYGLRSIGVGPRVRRYRKADVRAFLLHSDELAEPPSNPKE